MAQTDTLTATRGVATQGNTLVRNTFLLLSLVLGVAAAGAAVGLATGMGWGLGMWLVFMVAFIGGPFLIARMRGQAAIFTTFAWAGLIGFLLSPMIAGYLALPGGPSIVFNALATTAVLFTALSAYAVMSRRDFSFMRGFIFAGLLVVLLAIVANLFLQMPLLSVTISAAAVLLMCALILYDVSRLIHDGAASAIMITVSLFADIVVLFSHLLNLFAAFSGDD